MAIKFSFVLHEIYYGSNEKKKGREKKKVEAQAPINKISQAFVSNSKPFLYTKPLL